MQHQTIYRIDGLNRWSNADAVASRLSALPSVLDVGMDIVAGTALVTSTAPLPPEAVRAAVAQAGCTVTPSTAQGKDASRVSLAMFVCAVVVALIAGYTLSKVSSPSADAHATPVNASAAIGTHQHGLSTGIGGLGISSGYTLDPEQTAFAGPGVHELSFVITDGAGQVVTRFATVHTKPLHLILVRRDLTGYQHLHPQMSPDGVWSAVANLSDPGAWRAFADFTAIDASYAQSARTLGYDILVAGDFQPRPLATATTTSSVAGQAVSYQGVPAVGQTVAVSFEVSEDGEGAVELEPYLGALGHLVVLRAGDLGYLHVHPQPQQPGSSAKFWLTVPSPGSYRMYFDYQTDGQVRTAEFTLVVK